MKRETIVATNENIRDILASEYQKRRNRVGVIDLNHIDVSNVTDMSNLFCGNTKPIDISRWDVSHVTKMDFMFAGAKMSCDLSGWDVSNVKTMDSMFMNANVTGNISTWDVSGVADMSGMFNGAKVNSDITKWNIKNVSDMDYMFAYSDFNQDISGWDVSNVDYFKCMFYYSKFAQDISRWKVSINSIIEDMFTGSAYPFGIEHWPIYKKMYHIPKHIRVGYKKVRSVSNPFHTLIAKLGFPDDATILHSQTSDEKKCRANKCIVLGLYEPKKKLLFKRRCPNAIGVSNYDRTFTYQEGQRIEIDNFDTCMWNECSTGIHFFEKWDDAVVYHL